MTAKKNKKMNSIYLGLSTCFWAFGTILVSPYFLSKVFLKNSNSFLAEPRRKKFYMLYREKRERGPTEERRGGGCEPRPQESCWAPSRVGTADDSSQEPAAKGQKITPRTEFHTGLRRLPTQLWAAAFPLTRTTWESSICWAHMFE